MAGDDNKTKAQLTAENQRLRKELEFLKNTSKSNAPEGPFQIIAKQEEDESFKSLMADYAKYYQYTLKEEFKKDDDNEEEHTILKFNSFEDAHKFLLSQASGKSSFAFQAIKEGQHLDYYAISIGDGKLYDGTWQALQDRAKNENIPGLKRVLSALPQPSPAKEPEQSEPEPTTPTPYSTKPKPGQ